MDCRGAHAAGAALLTTNARHFPMPELTVLSVDEDGQLSVFDR
jgi:hypothetical protein